MSETTKIRNLQKTYLSTTSLTDAGYFFDDKTPEISNSEMLMTGSEQDADVIAQLDKTSHSIQDSIER